MPINFSSENYSQKASDFYQSIQEEKMEALFKKKRLSDFKQQRENTVKNASFALQYGMAAENMLTLPQSEYVIEQFDNVAENLFAPNRLDPTEISERIKSEYIELSKTFTDAEGKDVRIEGDEQFVKTIQDVMSGKEKATVLNNRLLGFIPDDIGGTFFDLSKEWSRASYMNAVNAPFTKSIAGQTPETLSRLADLTRANNETLGVMEQLFDMIDEDKAFLPTYNTESLLRQNQAMALQESTEWDRDGFFLWENLQGVLPTWLGGNEGIKTGSAAFGLDSPVEDFINYEDSIWMGRGDRKGIRTLLHEAIMGSNNLNPDIQNWLSSNPEVLNTLINSKNGAAFIAGLNKKKLDYKLAQAMNNNDGTMLFSSYAKIFGHGFTLDPFLGLDLVATGGFAAAKVLGKGAVIGTRLVGAGIPRVTAKITNKTPLMTDLSKMSVSALKTEQKAGSIANVLNTGVDNLNMLQKLMPSQIFSELLFPVGKRILSSGREEGKDLWRYLKDNDALPESLTQRAMYRAMAGSLEGLGWGYIEYNYASAYEDSLNVSMFGQAEADTIAYMRNQSGNMLQSMLMGGIMGGTLAPSIGGAFDGIGKGVEGTANIINKWSDSPKDNWLTKTSAFAEKVFDDKIAKTSWWGVTKSIVNIATENNITANARLSVNKAIPVVDFGSNKDQVAGNVAELELSLSSLAKKSAKAKVTDFQKAVNSVVKGIAPGETMPSKQFAAAVSDALANQVTDRLQRLGLLGDVVTEKINGMDTMDVAVQRRAMTLDKNVPPVAVGPKTGDSSSLTARRAAERIEENNKTRTTEQTKNDDLRKQLDEELQTDEPVEQIVEELQNQLDESDSKLEEIDTNILEDTIIVKSEGVDAAVSERETIIKNQAVFNKLLGEKVLRSIETEGITPISAMMVLGLDEDLVRKLKIGTSGEESAVLNRMLAFEEGTFTDREIKMLTKVVDENFLDIISLRDDVVPHTLFDTLVKNGVGQEKAFDEAYNFQFEEFTSRKAMEDGDILVDDQGKSILSEEQKTILNEAIEESKNSFDKLEAGDIEGFGFNKSAMQKMADALGYTKKFTKQNGPKKIKEAFDKATKEQKLKYFDTIVDKAITDDIYKSKQTQSIERIIKEAVESEASLFLRREKQLRRDNSKAYQKVTLEIDEFLRDFRELQKDKDLYEADKPARAYLEEVGTEQEKKTFKNLEDRQKKLREEIDDSVVNEKTSILNNKIRLASERITLENKPAIGFIRPMLKAFQSFNGHAIKAKSNPRNVTGSLETEFSYDISISKESVLGILKANNLLPMMKIIDTKHNAPVNGLPNYDTKIILDAFQDKLVQIAPSLRDVFIPGLERIYDRLYNTKIDGTGLYKGDGSIRNLLDYLDDTVLDGEAVFYSKQFAENGNRYFDGENYTLDGDLWNDGFEQAVNKASFGQYFEGNETPSQKVTKLLNAVNENLPVGRKLTNFNELGSTLGALDPQRAMRAVRSAVMGDKATTSSVSETELIVSNSRKEARRTLGANRAIGIQKETDTQLIDIFDQYEVQRRQSYLLDDTLTDEDYKKLENWLNNLNIKDIPNRVRAENSLLPTPVIKSLTKKLPKTIDELVEQNKQNMLLTVPALMSAIHDAILPMYDTSVSTDGQHYSWNYSLTLDDGSKVYPLRGLGFGNPIADARPDTFNSALAAATEITFNYESLIDTGFRTWETGKWRNKLSEESKKKVPEDISFAEFFFGDTFNNLPENEKKAISSELFPKVGEFDADASGNNVVVSIVNGVDGAKATREFLSTLVEEADAGMLDEFIENNYQTTYERTKEIIQKDLADPTQVNELKKSINKGETEVDLVSAIEIASAIFNYVDENGKPALDLKAIAKNPNMTAPYGASSGSMALAIKQNFFETYKQALIDDVSIPIDDQNFERLSRITATLLANGFHENSAKAGLAWVNKNLFGEKARNISNKSLRDTMTKFRQVKKDTASVIDLQPAGEIIKNPSAASSLVTSNAAKNEQLKAMIPQEASLSNTDSYLNMIRTVMGTAYALTNNGFYKNETIASESISDLITKMVRSIEESEGELKSAVEKGEFAQAKQLWSEMVELNEKKNIKLESLNSFIRQGHQLDETKFNEVLSKMGLEGFTQDIMNNMSPMGKKAFTQAFYRELAIGAGHNRMYTKVTTDLLPLSEEMLRPDKDDPFAVAKMVPDDLNPESFDANIRKLTVLDLAKKAASFVDDENMPEFESGKFEPSTYEMFLGQWKKDSELARNLREGAKSRLKYIEDRLNAETDEELLKPLHVLQKMLTKVIDSAEGSRDSSIDEAMKRVTGSETKQQINAMPGALGYLPKTFLSSFDTAPASILRKAQLEKQESVKTLRSLEKSIKDKRVTIPEDAFSREELGYVKTLGNIEDIKPVKFSSILPTSVFGTMALNITDSPSLATTQAVIKNELDLFVETVENVNVKKAHARGKYDTLLLQYFATLAKKEAGRTKQSIKQASDQFEKMKRDFVRSLDPDIRKDKVEVIRRIKNNSDLQMARKQLDLLIDGSLLEEENIMRSITQWGFDAKRNVTDLYDLMGESIDTVQSGVTIEEAVQNTIMRNDISAGNLLAWLANDASFLGEVLHIGTTDNGSPRSRYVDKNGLDRAETALNPLGVFSAGDSASLYLASYAQAYSTRFVVSRLLDKVETEIRSPEIQAFTQWWDATLRLDGDTARKIEADFPELAEALNKPDAKESILKDYAIGKKEAVKHFDNTGLLSEMTRSLPLTEVVANDLRERYPNLPKLLRNVDITMSVEKLLEQKSETLLQDKHKALVNQFGDVTAPSRIIGDAKIKLMAGEKLDAVNSIRNKELIDAIRFSSALHIDELPFNQTLSTNISGHDPFSRYGSSISKTRQQAAILTEAMKTLVTGGMESTIAVDKRNTFIVDGQAKQAEFLYYSPAQIDQAMKVADDVLATETLNDLNIDPAKKSSLLFKHEKDKESLNRALQLVPFLSQESSDYNIFKRQQMIRESMKGSKDVNDLNVYEDYVKNVKPILDDIKKELISQNEDSVITDPNVTMNTFSVDDLPNIHDGYNSMVESVNSSNERFTPTTQDTSVETPHVVSSIQESKIAEAEKNTLRPRTDGAEPLKGVNTVDDAYSDEKFARQSEPHRRFLHGLQPLVEEEVLTKNDLLLLKTVFNDEKNNKILQSFFDSDESVEFEINEDPFSSSSTDLNSFRSRIRIAHNLAKQFDELGKLGAAGVVLEELGHAIGKRMSNDGIAEFVINAKNLLKDKKGFDAFIKLEKEIFGSETRTDFKNRSNDLKKLMNEDMEISAVRSNESFGIMYAIATLLGENVQDLVNNQDKQSMTKLNEMSVSYISRLKSFYDVVESSPLSIEDITHPINIDANLKSTVYTHMTINRGLPNTTRPPLDGPNYNRATEFSDLEEQRNLRTRRLIKENTNESGQFNPSLLKNSPKDQLRAVQMKLDSLIEDISVGTLIDTPVFTLMSNLSMGRVSRRFVEKMFLNLAQPFGARRFAFGGGESGPEGLSGIQVMLLQMLDTKSLISTSAFNRPLPTFQGLQVHLDGVFEPLMKILLDIKRQNITLGMGQYSPYGTASKIFWKVVMNRANGTGRIQGWTDDATAKKIAVDELAKIFESQNEPLPWDNNTKTITDPQTDHTINMIVSAAKKWSNPTDGLWHQILTAQVDNGKFDASFAADAISEGVVPIKFSDDLFNMMPDDGGVDIRENFRSSFADHIYKSMSDNNNQFIHEDLFSIVFADNLVGDDLNAPEAILDLPAGAIYSEYTDKYNNRHDTAWRRFTEDIRSGKLSKLDLLGEDNVSYFYDIINRQDVEFSERQQKMMGIVEQNQSDRTARSGKRIVTNRRKNRLTEFVAEEYAMRAGSSSYTFVNDRFLNTADLLDDPTISSYINMDPIDIFDSLKRGQAGQAFDRQIMGNSLGMQGFGIGDLIKLLRNIDDESDDLDHVILNSELEVAAKRPLTNNERKRFNNALDQIENSYKFAMGNLDYSQVDKTSIGLINALTTIADAGTAVSVGPRLAMAALIEETPMAIVGELKSTLGKLQSEGRKSVGFFKNKDELSEWVEGIGFITKDLQFESNRILAKYGMDPRQFEGNKADKAVNKLYNISAIGLNKQTMVNRARGVRKWINEVNTMFMETSPVDTVSFTKANGEQVTVNTENSNVYASFDLIRDTIKEMGDLTQYSNKQLKSVLKELKMSGETMDVVIDMMKNGLFNDELSPIFKRLWSQNYETIIARGIPFEEMMKSVSFSYNTNKAARARYTQVIMAMREIAFNAATRYAKQPTLSENASIGSRPLGAFSRLAVQLTSYASSVFGSLRKASTVSPALLASAFLGHAISGYLYYKLVQMQNSKSFEDILKELEKDPMKELTDAFMSVPMFGMNQMVITTLLQVLRGERPSNTQIFNYASLAMINKMLQLPAKTIKNLEKMREGEILTGMSGLSSTVPLPYMPIVSMGLRSFDPKATPIVNFSGDKGIIISTPPKKTPRTTIVKERPASQKEEKSTTKKETTPAIKDKLSKASEFTDELKKGLDRRLGYS